MPTFKFKAPDGKQYTVNGPDGATEQEAFQMLQSQMAAPKPAAKPFGQQLNETIADVPRTLGRTARAGLQGVGGIADLVASPIRGALNLIPGVDIKPGVGRVLADGLGLPKPRPGMESVVDSAAEMVAGGVAPIAAGANMARNSTGVAQGVGKLLAAQPVKQIASAGAAGAAGAYTRETGGNDGSQLLASLAAGVTAPAAVGGAQRVGNALRQMATRQAPNPAQIEIQINRALEPGGMTLAQLAPEVQAGIRNDVAQALKVSDNLDPDALRRLVDYRTVGATPTAGKLTRNPALFTQEENLMRVGANSKDKAAQTLGSVKNVNNNRLIELLNGTGAGTADDAIGGGNKIMAALSNRDSRAKQIIGGMYDRARDSGGRSAPLDPSAFTQRAGNLLNESNVESFLTPDIRNKLNGFASGEIPLTVEIAEQFKTGIGRLQRNSADGNVRHALGLVRQALDDTPLMGPSTGRNPLLGGGQPADIGQAALNAFTKARRMNRSWMETVERTPALQAVRDGIEPDRFVQQFIVGAGPKANVADVEALRQSIKASPEAMAAVKGQIAATLKKAALSGASDEVGSFSQAGYNRAFDAIGDRKLGLFFSPEEVEQLKAIGRVASYEQKAPAGAFVNYSNTGGAVAGLLDRIIGSSVLSKIPAGRMLLQEPAENILIGMRSKSALDASKALQAGPRTRNQLLEHSPGLMLSPALLMGGSDEKR